MMIWNFRPVAILKSAAATLIVAITAAIAFAQGDWKTATVLPGVDMTGMSPASRAAALSSNANGRLQLRLFDNKIAECRVGDPGCGTSRRFGQFRGARRRRLFGEKSAPRFCARR